MNLASALKVALRSLRANRMRSALAMLGIVIGVAAVVVMVAIGSGANERIQAQISSIGSNLLLVLPGSTTAGGLRTGAGGVLTLTMGDARAIGRELPAVRLAAPTVRQTAPVVYGNRNWSTLIQGSTPEFFAIRDWDVSGGRHFTRDEVEGSIKAAVLGRSVAENLFGGEDPVGKIVRIRRVPFTVVGLLERKGQSPQGQDQDDIIVAPITTVQERLFATTHVGAVGAILVQAAGEENVRAAEGQVVDLLRQRHRIGAGEEDDFTVRNLSDMFAVAEGATRTLALLMGAIASVSLVVGGIGIMNIMLVSVTERTREIGVRLAVGARERDILLQFLIEAVVLTATGGVAGVLAGVGGSVLVSRLAGWSTLISPGAVLLAFAFAAAVGIFFGFYPARKASLMDPIEALRHE